MQVIGYDRATLATYARLRPAMLHAAITIDLQGVDRRVGLSRNRPIYAPVTGRALLATMRTMMRIINHIPAAKNAMARSERAGRGHDRQN